MNDDLQDMLNAMGALAEQLAFFRDQLIDHGFDEDEALTLCQELMRTMLKGK